MWIGRGKLLRKDFVFLRGKKTVEEEAVSGRNDFETVTVIVAVVAGGN